MCMKNVFVLKTGSLFGNKYLKFVFLESFTSESIKTPQ